VSYHDFVIDSSVPSDPKYEFKATKRRHVPVIDKDEEDDDG